MASMMKKLLQEAFKLAGQDLPHDQQAASTNRKPVVRSKAKSAVKPRSSPRHINNKSSPRKHSFWPKGMDKIDKSFQVALKLDTSCYQSGLATKSKVASIEASQDTEPGFSLLLSSTTSSLLDTDKELKFVNAIKPRFDGRLESITNSQEVHNTVELKIGLDFGTSSTKVVISDPQQDRAFAVPFFDSIGIEKYLLPGIIFKSDHYNLDMEGEPLRDLKLKLINDYVQSEDIAPTVAFFALIIRHARGWIFSEYESLYRNSEIIWSLNIGMPSADPNDSILRPRFELIGLAGWLAASTEVKLSNSVIKSYISEAALMLAKDAETPMIDLEIKVIPELTAQIYGYISSDRFDPNGRNIFMIVDIGAGTVDSSLFRVFRDKKMRWNFEMYTKAVENNGCINLHRHRIDWWRHAIQRFYPARSDLLESANSADMRSDCLSFIPNSLGEYFSGSKISFDTIDIDPDILFFKKKVKEQIFFKTYAAAQRENYLGLADLKEMPTLLCGGGMMMSFYQNLYLELDKAHPSASWLKAIRMDISQPRKMLAPSLQPKDYHRLSVAYGLSMMHLGLLEQASKGSAETILQNTYSSFVHKEMV